MTEESQCRVLIIEDESIVAFDARQILEGAGYEIVGIARDAVSALQLADATPPHVAIVDVDLVGGINGISVARELWERYAARVIFATGFGDDVLRDGYDFNYELIAKPFFEADLLDSVKRVQSA